MTFSVNWEAAYKAYLASGLSVVNFHEEGLRPFCESGLPSLKTVYLHFQKFKKQDAPAEMPLPKCIRLGRNMQMVTLTATQLQKKDTEEAHERRNRSDVTGEPALFRMQLPCGTRIEFMTRSPEALALQMMSMQGSFS